MKKYIQDETSLRLQIVFRSYKDIDDVVFAWDVLGYKHFEKAVYITAAVQYCDENKGKSRELSETLFPIICMRFIKSFYGVKKRNELRDLLEKGSDSDTYRNAKERSLKNSEPQLVMLGFNKHNPEAKKMHNRLFQMDVGERIMFISSAIKQYVLDGNDSAITMACAHKMVYEAMTKYEAAKSEREKKAVVNSLFALMKQTDKVKAAWE